MGEETLRIAVTQLSRFVEPCALAGGPVAELCSGVRRPGISVELFQLLQAALAGRWLISAVAVAASPGRPIWAAHHEATLNGTADMSGDVWGYSPQKAALFRFAVKVAPHPYYFVYNRALLRPTTASQPLVHMSGGVVGLGLLLSLIFAAHLERHSGQSTAVWAAWLRVSFVWLGQWNFSSADRHRLAALSLAVAAQYFAIRYGSAVKTSFVERSRLPFSGSSGLAALIASGRARLITNQPWANFFARLRSPRGPAEVALNASLAKAPLLVMSGDEAALFARIAAEEDLVSVTAATVGLPAACFLSPDAEAFEEFLFLLTPLNASAKLGRFVEDAAMAMLKLQFRLQREMEKYEERLPWLSAETRSRAVSLGRLWRLAVALATGLGLSAAAFAVERRSRTAE